MRRRVVAELLDSDQGSEQEVRDSLRDLELVNRFFGGVSSYCRLLGLIARRTRRREFELLDVAAATGFVALRAAERLRRRGIDVQTSLLDQAPTHLPSNGTPTVLGDALAMPVGDNCYDVVSCSLFMHHLEPREVVRFAQEALRVARVAVVISDIRRSRLHLMLTYAAWVVFRSRLSRHDGPASVRRAYTISEAREMLSHSGATRVEIERHYLYRIGAVLWK